MLSVRNLLDKCTGLKLSPEMRVYIVGHLIHRHVEKVSDLRREEWQEIRDRAFTYWPNGDWNTIDQNFQKEVIALEGKYRRDVLGQGTLF